MRPDEAKERIQGLKGWNELCQIWAVFPVVRKVAMIRAFAYFVA